LELARAGQKVLIIDSDSVVGGLASTFKFMDGVSFEKFYHHWFDNYVYAPQLVKSLGMQCDIVIMHSKTDMYFSGQHWRLSTRMDLLHFKPLSLIDRFRLGQLVLQVHRVKDWKTIEHLSIREWLEPLCGINVFEVVWQPLLESKFSIFSDAVNAVWMWKKLVLRGTTRDELAYFKGGFGRLAQSMAAEIIQRGGEVRRNTQVTGVDVANGKITAVWTNQGNVSANQYLFTPAFPVIAELFDSAAKSTDPDWLASLRCVKYLGNVCLVLELDRSLSDTCWLNVNGPGFPFVGVIEHTNFDSPANYSGKHIVYLSRCLAKEDPLWDYSSEGYLNFSLVHLLRMFLNFKRDWINDFHIWSAEFAQPVTERHYSSYVPGHCTPYSNAWISTMVQIYPEDRGTNYAIREGQSAANLMLAKTNPSTCREFIDFGNKEAVV
jgi:protoporphyrinogen oxidase